MKFAKFEVAAVNPMAVVAIYWAGQGKNVNVYAALDTGKDLWLGSYPREIVGDIIKKFERAHDKLLGAAGIAVEDE